MHAIEVTNLHISMPRFPANFERRAAIICTSFDFLVLLDLFMKHSASFFNSTTRASLYLDSMLKMGVAVEASEKSSIGFSEALKNMRTVAFFREPSKGQICLWIIMEISRQQFWEDIDKPKGPVVMQT
jgi:hypothetical protein